jgi:hypothetical protein
MGSERATITAEIWHHEVETANKRDAENRGRFLAVIVSEANDPTCADASAFGLGMTAKAVWCSCPLARQSIPP